MTTVAARKPTPQLHQLSECPCGWGRHCRCLTAYRAELRLVDLVRELLVSGSDLPRRRRAHASLREFLDLHDQRARDQGALKELYRVLPRQKDIDIVRRLTCEDYDAAEGETEIAARMRTRVEHVVELRARVAAAYAGRPLPVPQAWLDAAKARKKATRARLAKRAGRRAA